MPTAPRRSRSTAPDVVAKLVNGELDGRHAGTSGPSSAGTHAGRALVVAADAIGVEPKALRAAVRGGQSVADVADDHDVDPQAVIDAVVAAGEHAGSTQAVDAGKIDAERAEAVKERLAERITKLVNATPPRARRRS